jgi:hypothetical protein
MCAFEELKVEILFSQGISQGGQTDAESFGGGKSQNSQKNDQILWNFSVEKFFEERGGRSTSV